MFAVPFGRILWKEYRSQRALWLICAMTGVLFQLGMLWLSENRPHSVYVVADRLRELLAISGLFVTMYALGSGVMLFASEREARTSDWLLNLAAPPGPLLAAKIFFVIAATLSLQLVFQTIPFFLWLSTDWPFNPREGNIAEMILPVGLFVLIWSVFGSLVTRRVMVAVAAMMFLWVITAFLPLGLVGWLSKLQRMRSPAGDEIGLRVATLVWCAALIMIEVWIGWRWCQGNYWDGTLIEKWMSRFASWRRETAVDAALRNRILDKAEYEQSWRRLWQRLLWQERRRESLHRSLVIVECLLALATAVVAYSNDEHSYRFMFILLAGVVTVTPALIGVIGFAPDAQFQEPRFLRDRGISPASVWLAKQFIWMPRALLIFALINLVSFGFGHLLAFGRPLADTYRQFAQLLDHDLAPFVWLAVLSYCCGQLAAVLVRRSVLAAALSCILTLLCYGWFTINYQLGVPLWLSQGIPAVAMLAFTCWQMRNRMYESESWRLHLQQLLVITLFAVAMFAVVGLFRVYQIKTLPPLGGDLAMRWEADLARIRQRSVRLQETDFLGWLNHFANPASPGFRQFKNALDESNDEFLQLMKDDVSAHFLGTAVSFATPIEHRLQPVEMRVFFRANELLNLDQPEKSLEHALAYLRLTRLAANNRPFYGGWSLASLYQMRALDRLVIWANHPQQTAASIRAAIKEVDLELAQFPPAHEAIVAAYLYERGPMHVSGSSWPVRTLVERRREYNSMKIIPWETQRVQLLDEYEARLLFQKTSSLENGISKNDSVIGNPLLLDQNQPPADSRQAEINPLRGAIQEYRSISEIVLERQTAIRASLTRMALIAYRLEHQQLPGRLVDLTQAIRESNLVDPWSGRLFEYYPAFLLSAGPNQVELVPSSADLFVIRNTGFSEMTLTLNNRQLAGEDRKFIRRMQEVTAYKDQRGDFRRYSFFRRVNMSQQEQDQYWRSVLFMIPPAPNVEPKLGAIENGLYDSNFAGRHWSRNGFVENLIRD